MATVLPTYIQPPMSFISYDEETRSTSQGKELTETHGQVPAKPRNWKKIIGGALGLALVVACIICRKQIGPTIQNVWQNIWSKYKTITIISASTAIALPAGIFGIVKVVKAVKLRQKSISESEFAKNWEEDNAFVWKRGSDAGEYNWG